uniref:Nucleocapsid n=1 Tax=Leptomonas moramango virus TaxID=1859148 RepID=A0A191Z2Z8_9VIRU|nr:nucleocapsid [Leptomonas moramango virus]
MQAPEELLFSLELVSDLAYDGKTPFHTRTLIEQNGAKNKAMLVAMMVGCRGTNLDKILHRSVSKDIASEVARVAHELSQTLSVSLGHIAAAYPEVVYDARVRSGSPISVDTLAFLKHSGLEKSRWLEANREFCELVGIDYSRFLKFSDVIWSDDSFAPFVAGRKPSGQ